MIRWPDPVIIQHGIGVASVTVFANLAPSRLHAIIRGPLANASQQIFLLSGLSSIAQAMSITVQVEHSESYVITVLFSSGRGHWLPCFHSGAASHNDNTLTTK